MLLDHLLEGRGVGVDVGQVQARQRLALDELLASQLALRLTRAKMRRLPGRENRGDGRIASAIEAGRPGSFLVLHVQDTGTGITPEATHAGAGAMMMQGQYRIRYR